MNEGRPVEAVPGPPWAPEERKKYIPVPGPPIRPTRTLVFDDDQGVETLVTIWPDESVDVARRYSGWQTWGPPMRLVREERS